MLTSSTFQIEQHSFTKVPSCFCLWFSLFSFQWWLTEERAEYLCQDVGWHLIGSIALSQLRGQLRLPLCDPAKYRNSPKGLCMQASINRRLVTKMWIGHMLIVQMLTSSTLHIWQHSFTKVRSCCCLWFSLFSCRWGLTEERAEWKGDVWAVWAIWPFEHTFLPACPSMVFRVFDAAPRASILCQTRAAGSLFFQKHQRESDDMPKFNVFTGWSDFPMEVSDSSSLPCRKDAKILLHSSNLAENGTFARKTMGLRRWVGKSDLQPWSNKNALSAWRTEPIMM